jgi:hypothetical protein
MNPLHRLPNGAWIDLVAVSGVSPHDADATAGPEYARPPHVILVRDKGYVIVPFDSFDAAQRYADELAGLVNEARAATTATNQEGPPPCRADGMRGTSDPTWG